MKIGDIRYIGVVKAVFITVLLAHGILNTIGFQSYHETVKSLHGNAEFFNAAFFYHLMCYIPFAEIMLAVLLATRKANRWILSFGFILFLIATYFYIDTEQSGSPILFLSLAFVTAWFIKNTGNLYRNKIQLTY
ncbi:hypothetical protein [Robertkochia solimangrovi]|uniref:hypothetical protein n=1 Tax=Robertkochia solimangrovi TaxID=2213046 RepID=UPI00117C3AF0|nr:hypothetical protein [Robertkochia solimangrovi]TRZ41784.1 hypothetical protein DMZ48_15675 [Robertkochia solimangrovi]